MTRLSKRFELRLKLLLTKCRHSCIRFGFVLPVNNKLANKATHVSSRYSADQTAGCRCYYSYFNFLIMVRSEMKLKRFMFQHVMVG